MTPGIENDTDVRSYSSLLKLNPQGATPPTEVYIGVDNLLFIVTSCSQANVPLTIIARILMPDGTVKPNVWNVILPNSRFGNTVEFNLPEGFLLSLALYTNLGSQSRTAFVEAYIVQGQGFPFLITGALCSGYPSQYTAVSWPNGVNTNNLDCYGNTRAILGTMPSAGANITETCPQATRWRMVSVTFTLATSAAVANRFVFLQFTSPSITFTTLLVNTIAQAASTTVTYCVAVGLVSMTNGAGSFYSAPMPEGMFMLGQYNMQTSLTGLQAGDQLSAPSYIVEEWLCP